jgi:hypothetical protein
MRAKSNSPSPAQRQVQASAPESNFLSVAAEVSRAGVPTVMIFVQSLHGISHNKIEDTKEEHLELCVRAFDKLAEKAMGWVSKT